MSSLAFSTDLRKTSEIGLCFIGLACCMELKEERIVKLIQREHERGQHLPVSLLGLLLLLLFSGITKMSMDWKHGIGTRDQPLLARELPWGAEISEVHALAHRVVGVDEYGVLILIAIVVFSVAVGLLGLGGLYLLLLDLFALCARQLGLTGGGRSVIFALLFLFGLFLFFLRIIVVVVFFAVSGSPLYGKARSGRGSRRETVARPREPMTRAGLVGVRCGPFILGYGGTVLVQDEVLAGGRKE